MELVPITTSLPAAPNSLFKLISRSCTKRRGPVCSCRKSELKCTMICNNCRGQSCLNSNPIYFVEDENNLINIEENFNNSRVSSEDLENKVFYNNESEISHFSIDNDISDYNISPPTKKKQLKKKQ
jgi:hypothetical protein